MIRKLKWAALALLLSLAVIVCMQNLATVQLHFLFTKIELPQAVVLGGALAIGFLMGVLATALWKLRAWRLKVQQDKANQAKLLQQTQQEKIQ